MLSNNNSVNAVDVDEVKEVLSLISKLDTRQKELLLATMRGAVMIADSGRGEEN